MTHLPFLAPLKLTHAMLWHAKACKGQRTLFREVFPKGMLVTAENLALADDRGLDLEWFYDRLDRIFGKGAHVKRAVEAQRVAANAVFWLDDKVKLGGLGDPTFRTEARSRIRGAKPFAIGRAVENALRTRRAERKPKAVARPTLRLAAKTKRGRKARS